MNHAINNITVGNRARSKRYTINAQHITEEDQVFRHWKELEGSFRRFEGIKKKPIAEVRFDAVEVEAQRQVEVSYRLVNEESWRLLTILKRQAVWPKPGGLSDPSRLPSLVPWKNVKHKRHVTLNKYVRELSSPPTPEQLSYYANIPHHPLLRLDRDSDLRIVTEGKGKFKTNYQAQKQVMPSLIPSLRMIWRS